MTQLWQFYIHYYGANILKSHYSRFLKYLRVRRVPAMIFWVDISELGIISVSQEARISDNSSEDIANKIPTGKKVLLVMYNFQNVLREPNLALLTKLFSL